MFTFTFTFSYYHQMDKFHNLLRLLLNEVVHRAIFTFFICYILLHLHFSYYHQMDKFHNLLRLLSNEVVHRAISMVGENILREPLEVSTCSVSIDWYKLYVKLLSKNI